MPLTPVSLIPCGVKVWVISGIGHADEEISVSTTALIVMEDDGDMLCSEKS